MTFFKGGIAAIIMACASPIAAQSISFSFPHLTYPTPPAADTDTKNVCDDAASDESCPAPAE